MHVTLMEKSRGCIENFTKIVYLVNYIEIQYCVIAEREAMVFANPREVFHPKGAKLPRDEMTPKGQQIPYASQSAITQQYCYIEFTKLEIYFVVILLSFHEKNLQIHRNSFAVPQIFRQIDEIFFNNSNFSSNQSHSGSAKVLHSLGSLQNLQPPAQ